MHRRFFLAVFALTLAIAPAHFVRAATPDERASLHVDATDIARRLIGVRMDIPVQPGPLELNYVEWTPGNHNPSGPIQNVVDLTISDDRGRTIAWTRDPEKLTRIRLEAARDASVLSLRFTYITNQPSVVSRSTDSYGFPTFGGLNWNTVLFYPDNVDKDEYIIEPTLRLPGEWRIATSLTRAGERPGEFRFEPVSLAELVDSPVIFGSTLKTYELNSQSPAPHSLHAVAPFPSLTELGAERLEKFGVMVDQAIKVFGPFPYKSFHFLAMLSNDLPNFGVEHTQSTIFSEPEETFINAEKDGDPIGVIPHEYIHAWCGKLRAPAGLHARNYHTTVDTRLLWVYEGLTTYYDDVLAVRSGLIKPEEYINLIADRIADYQLRRGRQWRSVEDTAVFLRHLRAPSASWGDKRRGVAYYSEGALFWMEADAIIRRGTKGDRSLDDFARAFFDVPAGPAGSPVEYTRDDVVRALRAVYDGEDWDALIRARIEAPVDNLEFELVRTLGRELRFFTEPTGEQRKADNKRRGVDARFTLGFSANASGEITRIIPDSLADRAKIAPGMKIIAVNDYTYSARRLREAIERSPETQVVTLLVEFGDKMETIRILYGQGPQYPRLVKTGAGPDLLEEIMAPR